MNTLKHAPEAGDRLVLLSGGGGGARLAGALSRVASGRSVAVVTNPGDDFEHLGLLICPDTDSVLYAASQRIDPGRGWGRAGESWGVFDELRDLDGPDWFQLGDKDIALHLLRASLLSEGLDLVKTTESLARRLAIPQWMTVLPATESAVRTKVVSDQGELGFQEYFVARRCEPALKEVFYAGIEVASPSDALRDFMEPRDGTAVDVVLGPSNPFLSLAPILDIPEMVPLLREAARRVVAVSPIVDGKAIKGPAAKIMSELGLTVSAAEWTRWIDHRYPGLVDVWVWDVSDQNLLETSSYESRDIRVTSTLMSTPEKADRFVAWLLEACCNAD